MSERRLAVAICPNCSFHFPSPVDTGPARAMAVKWRDCGNTAEVLYTGVIRRRYTGGHGPMVTIEVTECTSGRGWEVGDVEEEFARNIIMVMGG